MKRATCKILGCEKPRYGLLTHCYSHYSARARAKKEERERRKKDRKLRSKKYQTSDHKNWKKRCWKLMSEYVRRKDADWRGMVSCFTCYTSVSWKDANASHFIHGTLDLDERNLKAACIKCNLYLSGNLANYALRLVKEYGLEWVEQLRADAAQHQGYGIDELKRIHADLTARLEVMKP